MKLLSVVGALALVFGITSCSQEMMEKTYTPDNYNVTFEGASATYSLEGQDLVVKVNRGVAKEAISVPVTLTDPNGVYSLNKNTADFAEGEYTTELKLSYNPESLKPVVNYTFTLAFDAAYMAASGTNKITAACQMPLVYQDWGTVVAYQGTLFQFFAAEDKVYNIQIADYTNNYYKIQNFLGSDVDLEFNLTNGAFIVTAPKLIANKYFPTYPMASFPSAGVFNGQQLTAWFDTDPSYIPTAGLTAEGTLQKGSMFQFDSFWTTPSTYLSAGGKYWFPSIFAVTEVK